MDIARRFGIVLILLLCLAAVPAGSTPSSLPDFSLVSLTDGRAIDAASLRDKTVLINFWATWCPPCRREIPSLVRLQDEYAGQDVVVVGIAVDRGGPEAVRRVMQSAGINYTVAMAAGGVTDDFGGVFGIPATFVYAPGGRLVTMFPGYADHDSLAAGIERARR